MNTTQRSVFISAAVGALCNGVTGLFGLMLAGHVARPRLLGPTEQELALDLALLAFLLLVDALICAGTGALFAGLTRSENLPARKKYVLGGAAGALAYLLPMAFFGAVSAVVRYAGAHSAAGVSSSWWLSVLGAIAGGLLAVLIAGCLGAGGAAIAVKFFGARPT